MITAYTCIGKLGQYGSILRNNSFFENMLKVEIMLDDRDVAQFNPRWLASINIR